MNTQPTVSRPQTGVKPIDPASTAGILLREFDTPEQAMRYALRKAAFTAQTHPESSRQYKDAARAIAQHCGLPSTELDRA